MEYGYFWMLRDLRQTAEKPILSNVTLIPEQQAKLFPTVPDVQCLDNINNNNNAQQPSTVTLPDHWLRNNRTHDPAAQITVVGLAFRDYGSAMLDAWLGPLQDHLAGNDRAAVVRFLPAEGYMSKYVLQPWIMSSMRNHTPADQWSSTWTHFAGPSLNAALRDPLRAHNLLTAYIYLLDGVGRVRFAASGPPDDDGAEVERLQTLADQLLQPTLQHQTYPSTKRGGSKR